MPRHRVTRAKNRALRRATAAAAAVGTALVGCVVLGNLTGADAAGRILMVSAHPDRSGARVLAGQTISGTVYIFVKAPDRTSQIVFYLDNSRTPVSTERVAPFDLATTARGGQARPFDVSALGAGTHAVHYRMTFGGTTVTNNATFTVARPRGAAEQPGLAPTTPVTTPTATSPRPAPTTPTTPTSPPTTTTAPPTSTTAPVGSGAGALGLDRSGRTVPDSSYPVPGGAVFLATSGSDDNPGTQGRPVYSLGRALALVPSGGTIVARGGVYRDWYAAGDRPKTVSKPFTLQAFPHEQVWFDGTDVVPGSRFRADGSGHWTLGWSTPSFCMGQYYARAFAAPSRTPHNDQCAYWDSALGNPAAADPQMVYVDGVALREVSSPRLVDAGSFAYAQDLGGRTGALVLGVDPSRRYVEVTARPAALAVQGTGTRILGIGFRRYATNILGSTTTGAVYSAQASGLTIENSAFVQNAGPGFSGSLQRGVVRHSVFTGNGANGITSNGHYRAGTPDGTLIETSVFDGNNAERFDVGCSASCTAANIKLNHMNGFTVRDDVIANAGGQAKGVWCDLACTDGAVVRNLVTGNGGHGIFYEVSDRGIIASNLVADNRGRGIQVASADTKVYNNTLRGQLVPFNVYDDARSYGVDGWTDVGPDTRHVQIANNVVQGTGNMINCGAPTKAGKNAAPNTGCRQIFDLLDDNGYAPAGGVVSYQFGDLGAGTPTVYRSMAAFREAYGLDRHSDASPATSGVTVPLPADVAAALGLRAGTALPRGAAAYPGR